LIKLTEKRREAEEAKISLKIIEVKYRI